jgi:hypothetical protein
MSFIVLPFIKASFILENYCLCSELSDTDYDKTIVISVWNQVDVDTRTDLLGCLKFSVETLKQKQVGCNLLRTYDLNTILHENWLIVVIVIGSSISWFDFVSVYLRSV